MIDRFPLGYNTYSIRALKWNDLPLIEYAASLKLDAIFLQDSIDPGINDPAHWKEVKDLAKRHGLWLGTGGSAVLPRSDESAEFDRSVKLLRDGIKRAVGMGSPLVRMLLAGDHRRVRLKTHRHHDQVLRTVQPSTRASNSASESGDSSAGRPAGDRRRRHRFVGSYLDTGNPSSSWKIRCRR